MSGLPLLLLLVACGGDSENPPSPSKDSLDTGRTTPTPHTGPGAEPAAALALSDVQQALTEGVQALVTVDPRELYRAVDEAMQAETAGCPGSYEAVGVTRGWANDCTTPGGWGFSGRSQFAWLSPVRVEDDTFQRYGEFITTATLTDPDGATLAIEGYGDHREWTEGLETHSSSWLFGTFRHQGTWLSEPWLDDGASLSITLYRVDQPGQVRVELEGGLSRSSVLPPAIAGVSTEGLALQTEGADCRTEGAVHLQGRDGARVVIDLTGDTCEACGRAQQGETDLGEVCVDLQVLLTVLAPEAP